MTLEKRQLGFLRVWLVLQFLADSVCGSGLLCLADLEKQVVLLFLKLTIAGLQSLSAIFGCVLFEENRLLLCCCGLSLTLGFFLLFLICRVICSLLRRVCAGLLLVIVKALSDVFRQFSKVNFCDSRLGLDDDAVGIDADDTGVFVFFAINGFEVL